MDYSQTLEWLYQQLPMYQREGKAAYKANLKTSIALAEALGNPQNDFPSVHIAGTNGKGSTAHYIASILQENGFKVGLHCSPHYFDFRERIKINGMMVEKAFVSQFVEDYKAMKLALAPSFFELTVLMAFAYFKQQEVDIAIIETGMGGRLDTTNIIQPLVSVITNIGLDHTQFLGEDIEAIAIEKAGIIKSETPVVVGEMDVNALEMIYAVAEEKDAEIHMSPALEEVNTKSIFQQENIATAVSTINTLQDLNWNISEKSIVDGISNVCKNTSFIGRWQQVNEKPIVILDSAHNGHGIMAMIESLEKYEYDTLRIVIGMVEDKDSGAVLSELPKDAVYYYCKAEIPRGRSAHSLKEEAEYYSLKGSIYPSVEKAYGFAIKDAIPKDMVLVIGSIFVVGEVLSFLSDKK